MTELSAMDRWIATNACSALMYEYAYRLDHGLGSTVWELFTADGEWTSPTIHSVGTAGLRSYFARRDAMTERVTRHVVVNLDIRVESAQRATARSVAIEYRDEPPAGELSSDTAPAIVGDYSDEFRCVEGVWLFHRRHTDVAFKRAGEKFIAPDAGDVAVVS